MDILSKFAERLNELLNEAEINAAKLAKDINIEQSAISKFSRAQRLPSTETLVSLANYFNCTTDYILGLSDVLDDRKFKCRPPFSDQFNFLLKKSGITKYRFEKETNFSEITVNRWQRGTYEPSVENLVKIAEYFNCSVDYLLGRED